MYPGFSLHDELEQLVRNAGFTPMEVLRIATDGIPGFYAERKEFGGLEPGQVAAFVLLDADPLADIRNTRRIAGVYLQRRWLSRKDLDKLLQTVEQSARTGCKGLIPVTSPR